MEGCFNINTVAIQNPLPAYCKTRTQPRLLKDASKRLVVVGINTGNSRVIYLVSAIQTPLTHQPGMCICCTRADLHLQLDVMNEVMTSVWSCPEVVLMSDGASNSGDRFTFEKSRGKPRPSAANQSGSTNCLSIDRLVCFYKTIK